MTTEPNIDEQRKTEQLTGSGEGGTDMSAGDEGGEDEGSAPKEGNDDHLKENQKTITK